MQILQVRFCALVRPFMLCARKNARSIGINKTNMATKILNTEPEYQVIRDGESNTAVSSVAVTLL